MENQSGSDDSDAKFTLPVLEMPPEAETPSGALGPLLSDESVAHLTVKQAALESVFRLITRDCSFTEFMSELLLSTMRAIPCEAGSILEVNYNTNTLFFRAVVGQSSDQLSKFQLPMGQGIAGFVAESRQPLNVTDTQENKKHMKSVQNAVGFNARNICAAPLIIRGKAFGVLELLNRVGEEAFTSSDMELLKYLAEICAKGIEIRLMIAWAQQSGMKKEAA